MGAYYSRRNASHARLYKMHKNLLPFEMVSALGYGRVGGLQFDENLRGGGQINTYLSVNFIGCSLVTCHCNLPQSCTYHT